MLFLLVLLNGQHIMYIHTDIGCGNWEPYYLKPAAYAVYPYFAKSVAYAILSYSHIHILLRV